MRRRLKGGRMEIGMAERLNHEIFKTRIAQEEKLVLIDFYSDSCIPCKRMSPVLAELEESYGDHVYIGKVNAAFEPELLQEYGVLSAPTLLFFKNGIQIKRLNGVVKKAELEEFIKENIE